MGRPSFEFELETEGTVQEVVERLKQQAEKKGFKVLAVHDFAATLKAKGFEREPLSVIEVCNAKYASRVLDKDVRIALMLPCPIAVFAEKGKTVVATMRPSALESFYAGAGIGEEAREVEKAVLEMMRAVSKA